MAYDRVLENVSGVLESLGKVLEIFVAKRVGTLFINDTIDDNKYVGPPYCRAKIYAGCVACCPLVSHGEYADATNRHGRTSDRIP